MSLWKWNNVELEVDMEDAEFLERYEAAFKKMGETEKTLQKTGSQSEIVKEFCKMFYDLFDDLFGDGTGDQLFTGKMNSRICEECYDSFLAECQKGILAAAERRNNRMNKFRLKNGSSVEKQGSDFFEFVL